MTGEYKKFSAHLREDEKFERVVFCHKTSYEFRKVEVENWLKKLIESEGISEYEVDVSDSNWSEATINRNNLFETHFGE